MSYKGLPEQLVAKINSMDARNYARASGWKRSKTANGKVAVFSHPSSDLDQLIIPLDPSLSDYARRMSEVVSNLAEKENRPTSEVLNDLLLPPSDVLRFRIDQPDSQSGFLSLEQGINLLAGAKKSLLSAACSVIQPQPHHPRLSRSEAEQFIRSSTLCQTERGSFTAVISCPLEADPDSEAASVNLPLFAMNDEADLDAAPIPGSTGSFHIPFARQVTSLLMRSVARITRALDSDSPDSLLDSKTNEAPISSNLCDALMSMQPFGERSRLCLLATWSRAFPPPIGDSPPSIVELRREYFPTIASVGSRLRPSSEPQVSRFFGMVDSLHGDPDEYGHVQGEVQLLIFDKEETTKARVTLNPEEYRIALLAHGQGGYVALTGILIRSNRSHRIDEVKHFRELRDSDID